MTDDVKQKDTRETAPWTGELDYLHRRSQEGGEFRRLMRDVQDPRNILMARDELAKSPGSHIAGKDGKTIADLLHMPDGELIAYVLKRLEYYRPQPVLKKRVEGEPLPFGIPTIGDRLIQQCVKQVLEPIAEARFIERSNGYRPMRRAEHALAQCYAFIQKRHMYYALSFKLQDVMKEIPAGKVLRRLWSMGVREKKFLSVVGAMLHTGTANIAFPKKDSPGGGVISPLLANIVLDELDHWVQGQWEDFPTRDNLEYVRKDNGVIDKSRKYKVLRERTNLKEVYIVRYADSVVVFAATHDMAKRMGYAVQDWLEHRLKIHLPIEGFKVYRLRDRWMPFMGFRLRARQKGKTRQGEPAWVVESHVSDEALTTVKETLRHLIWQIQHSGGLAAKKKAIRDYNAYVSKVHSYYRYATHVSADFHKIAYGLKIRLHNRIQGLTAAGPKKAVPAAYKGSQEVRFVLDMPILPVAYVKTKAPHYKKRDHVPYTPEGRAAYEKSRKSSGKSTGGTERE